MPTRTRLNLTTSALAIAIGCGVPAAVQAHNDVGIAKGSGFDGPHEEILAGLLDGDIAKANLPNAARFGIAQVFGQRGLTATDRTVNGVTCTGFEVGCIEGCVAHAAVDLAIYNGPFANARPNPICCRRSRATHRRLRRKLVRSSCWGFARPRMGPAAIRLAAGLHHRCRHSSPASATEGLGQLRRAV